MQRALARNIRLKSSFYKSWRSYLLNYCLGHLPPSELLKYSRLNVMLGGCDIAMMFIVVVFQVSGLSSESKQNFGTKRFGGPQESRNNEISCIWTPGVAPCFEWRRMVAKKFKHLFHLDQLEQNALRKRLEEPDDKPEDSVAHSNTNELRSRIVDPEQATLLGWTTTSRRVEKHESTESANTLRVSDFDGLGELEAMF